MKPRTEPITPAVHPTPHTPPPPPPPPPHPPVWQAMKALERAGIEPLGLGEDQDKPLLCVGVVTPRRAVAPEGWTDGPSVLGPSEPPLKDRWGSLAGACKQSPFRLCSMFAQRKSSRLPSQQSLKGDCLQAPANPSGHSEPPLKDRLQPGRYGAEASAPEGNGMLQPSPARTAREILTPRRRQRDPLVPKVAPGSATIPTRVPGRNRALGHSCMDRKETTLPPSKVMYTVPKSCASLVP